DPQALETFRRSRLDWTEIERPPHDGVLALYRDGLWLRHTLAPEGVSGQVAPGRVRAIDPATIAMRRRRRVGGDLLVVARLAGAGAVTVPIAAGGPWRVRLSTEADHVVADPAPARIHDESGRLVVSFERPGAVVLEPVDAPGGVAGPGSAA
ncbi:MAG: DUF3459 domain-containing protein, partial [Vicinamibacterales bacterium]